MGSKYVAFPVTNCNIVSDILEDCCYVYLAKLRHLLRIDTISSKAALSEEIFSHYRLKKRNRRTTRLVQVVISNISKRWTNLCLMDLELYFHTKEIYQLQEKVLFQSFLLTSNSIK